MTNEEFDAVVLHVREQMVGIKASRVFCIQFAYLLRAALSERAQPVGYFQGDDGHYEQVQMLFKDEPDVFPLYRTMGLW